MDDIGISYNEKKTGLSMKPCDPALKGFSSLTNCTHVFTLCGSVFFRFISPTLQAREKTKKTSGPRKYSSIVTKKKIACEQALQCEGPPPLLARSLQGRFPRHNWRACSPAKKEPKTNQKLQVKIMTAWKVVYGQTVFFPQN